jgi:hypothetical protein
MQLTSLCCCMQQAMQLLSCNSLIFRNILCNGQCNKSSHAQRGARNRAATVRANKRHGIIAQPLQLGNEPKPRLYLEKPRTYQTVGCWEFEERPERERRRSGSGLRRMAPSLNFSNGVESRHSIKPPECCQRFGDFSSFKSWK